jgi:hypothetical protein
MWAPESGWFCGEGENPSAGKTRTFFFLVSSVHCPVTVQNELPRLVQITSWQSQIQFQRNLSIDYAKIK